MDKQKIGKLIMQLRLAKNLSQKELAKDICTQSFLSRLESGGTEITLQKIVQLLERMGVTLAEFEYIYLSSDSLFQKKERLLYDYYTLNFHLLPNGPVNVDLPFMNEMLDCFNYTFNTSFALSEKPNYEYLSDILLQDEFFNRDYAPVLYALPTLSLETAIYTSTRLLAQFSQHQISKTHPYLKLLFKIVMANIFFVHNDKDKSITLLIETLESARKLNETNYIIVTLLLLYKLTTRKIYQKEAYHLNELFLKDNFYEYWYNVLID